MVFEDEIARLKRCEVLKGGEPVRLAYTIKYYLVSDDACVVPLVW